MNKQADSGFYGWKNTIIFSICSTITLGMVFYGFSVIFPAIVKSMGWGRGQALRAEGLVRYSAVQQALIYHTRSRTLFTVNPQPMNPEPLNPEPLKGYKTLCLLLKPGYHSFNAIHLLPGCATDVGTSRIAYKFHFFT